MKLVRGHDAEIAEWAGQQVGVKFTQPLAAFGVVDTAGVVRGAAIFNDYYRGGNVEVTYVGPKSVTRSVIFEVMDFAFNQLGASRMTAQTAFRNLAMRKILPKMGFVFEMTRKRYYGPKRGDDAVMFVLYKEKATRWLEMKHV